MGGKIVLLVMLLHQASARTSLSRLFMRACIAGFSEAFNAEGAPIEAPESEKRTGAAVACTGVARAGIAGVGLTDTAATADTTVVDCAAAASAFDILEE